MVYSASEGRKALARNLTVARLYYVRSIILNNCEEDFNCAVNAVYNALRNDAICLDNSEEIIISEDVFMDLVYWFVKYTKTICGIFKDWTVLPKEGTDLPVIKKRT